MKDSLYKCFISGVGPSKLEVVPTLGLPDPWKCFESWLANDSLVMLQIGRKDVDLGEKHPGDGRWTPMKFIQ